MKKIIGSVFLVFVFLTVLLSGCTPASTPVPSTLTPISPTDTPVPTATSLPANTPTPEPIAEIQTSEGAATITSVEHSPTYPLKCDPSLSFLGNANGCSDVASTGYELVIVTFIIKDSTGEAVNIHETVDTDFLSNIFDANIYITADNDEPHTIESAGGSESLHHIMFSVPIGAKSITLYWEDNSPIKLP